VRHSGEIVKDGLGGQALYGIVMRRARQAGLDDFSPHMLRRGFASALLRRGHDHLMVARALRHRDVRSVERYDGRTDLERAMAIRSSIRVTEPGGKGEVR
jgi:integrase